MKNRKIEKKCLFIITGTSRGLGEALARKSLIRGDTLISLSRKRKTLGKNHHALSFDLSGKGDLRSAMMRALAKVQLKTFSRVQIIHNAALLEPIGEITTLDQKEVESHFQVNLLAPIFLTKFLVKRLKSFEGEVVFSFITSGAATRPISHWGPYCSSKAALNMFVECLSNDNNNTQRKFITLSPGLMDTKMQTQIRSKSNSAFPEVDLFKDYQKKGQLVSPDLVADSIIQFLNQNDIGSKVHFWYNNGTIEGVR